MLSSPSFYDEPALLDRLQAGLKKRSKEVVFVLGSALSTPIAAGEPGVPGAQGVIDLIRKEFDGDAGQLARFDETINRSGANRYQESFTFLLGRRGQQTANEIVRSAVLSARTSPLGMPQGSAASVEDQCRAIEHDMSGWSLNPGTAAVGKLIAAYPHRFGASLLTTNFDPLLEVSVRHAYGSYFRTGLHSDGNLWQTEGTGCHIVHLHGYWYGSDTLHTARQLGQPRPRLKASLASLLRDKLVVVCGYGGWDDAFTGALVEVAGDDSAFPEIIWTFHQSNPELPEPLLARLAPGIDRGRIALYAGIDCNTLLPQLYDGWTFLESPTRAGTNGRSNLVTVPDREADRLLNRRQPKAILEGDDEDRPPLFDLCLGREDQLNAILASNSKTVFITGLGGQGKSTLAAKYCQLAQATASSFSYFVWRDCKEESERFENQLASVIETLSDGRFRGKDLAQQSGEAIVDLLITLIRDTSVLFVFDNADHYVDLESRRMVGLAEHLVHALRVSPSNSRVLFTCRPSVQYPPDIALSIRLEGIDLEATKLLFAERKAPSSPDDIASAHALTGGHAFWLDLLAAQVAQRAPGRDLRSLLGEMPAGGGPLPVETLNSIWVTLRDREQAVLRVMAETVKPETERDIADYLDDQFNFNKISRALRALRLLNLVVTKRRRSGLDLVELHPLVRQFIRQNFKFPERASYINKIIRTYKRMIGRERQHLKERPRLSVLQYWTQNAELDISVGNLASAISVLAEVSLAFESSAFPREFARVVRRLLSNVDWVVQYARERDFDLVLRVYISVLSYLGEHQEVDGLLDLYEGTVVDRDSRYISYCQLRANCYWVRGEFAMAMHWGKKGKDLIESSGVDTEFGPALTYTLALAQRDGGQPEVALSRFLDGRKLSEVIDPDELDEARGEQHYGNAGRCLHLIGQIEPALVCYQKSALIIERNTITESAKNQAYIRAWIGELLIGRSEFQLAGTFLRAAIRRWERLAPPKAEEAMAILRQIEGHLDPGAQLSIKEAEKVCLDWIVGHDIDFSRPATY